MNELPPPSPVPPPPPAAPVEQVDDGPVRIASPVGLFLVTFAAATVAGVLLGGTVGFVIGAAANADCTPTDTWCELGGAIYGFLTGMLVAVTSYLVVGIVTIRRCRPRGRRAAHVAAHVVAPFAIAFALLVLGSVMP